MSVTLLVLSAGLAATPSLSIEPPKARPGDVVRLRLTGDFVAPSGLLGAREVRFYPTVRSHDALAALPTEQKEGPLAARAQESADGGSRELTAAIEVLAGGFAERELSVAGKYVEPPRKVRRWLAADKQAFAKAFAQPWGPPRFHRRFQWPRSAAVTAPYGDLRVYNGKKQSQHYGTDLDGKPGDSVAAANDGTVVMARACYTSGNTVLLHHGAGLYTAYFHLSKILVKRGAEVKQGGRLGLVGKTGRVTGPHLHFGVKLDGLWVNPESLLQLDFD